MELVLFGFFYGHAKLQNLTILGLNRVLFISQVFLKFFKGRLSRSEDLLRPIVHRWALACAMDWRIHRVPADIVRSIIRIGWLVESRIGVHLTWQILVP